MIKPLLISMLETALNRYLALDEHASDYLTPLAGKVIGITVLPFNHRLYFCPTTSGIQILDTYPDKADATLSGTLSSLGLMGLSSSPMRSLFKGQVHLAGDTQLARRFQRLFEKLDIDWEGKLASYTGPGIAQRLGGLVRGSRSWGQHSLNAFRLNLEEFLQEETRELPAKPEAEIVFRQIDTCRMDCDRLTARIQRLTSSANTSCEPLD